MLEGYHSKMSFYKGYSVTRVNKLQYYAATRISPASECFVGICGYWRHYMKPSDHVLGIHLPRQKIILTSGPSDALEKIDIPSPLDRCFGRPINSSYDQLTYTLTITLGILSMPIQPPVMLIKMPANLSASSIQKIL
jgi:hypothetical protein